MLEYVDDKVEAALLMIRKPKRRSWRSGGKTDHYIRRPQLSFSNPPNYALSICFPREVTIHRQFDSYYLS